MNKDEKIQLLTQSMPTSNGEIVLYQPDANINIEVKIDSGQNTVWLSIDQMAQLFARDKSVIGKHVRAIFREGELQKESVWAKFAYTASDGKTYNVDFYNLDVIISVGYRVHSQQGTAFRIWATSVLRDHLLRGYSISRHLVAVQQHFDDRMTRIEARQESQQQQLDFFIRTGTPPAEMVFFNGQFFTARVAIESIIKTARRRAIIIDHYVDAKTFDLFDVRQPGVEGIIYTQGVGQGMMRLRDEHNRQVAVQPVEVYKWRIEPHDRFLIVDDTLYHCGHSLNATGQKMSSIMQMGTSPETILSEIV